MGTHHPRHPDMVYPVNYGYVERIMAADGAAFHHFNDVEDKWIVSLDGREIPDDKILGDIAFQEQFFYGKLYG